jgi:hypothetical protein
LRERVAGVSSAHHQFCLLFTDDCSIFLRMAQPLLDGYRVAARVAPARLARQYRVNQGEMLHVFVGIHDAGTG